MTDKKADTATKKAADPAKEAGHYDQDHATDLDGFDDVESGYQEGDLVTVTHLDTATGLEVVRYGTVIEVLDDVGPGAGAPEVPAVRVAYLGDVTGPLPLDHTVHGRDDAPRVELVAQIADNG